MRKLKTKKTTSMRRRRRRRMEMMKEVMERKLEYMEALLEVEQQQELVAEFH